MNVVPGWDSLLREIEVKIRSKVETDRGVLARHVLWSGENGCKFNLWQLLALRLSSPLNFTRSQGF